MAQENSRKAIMQALSNSSSNLEFDIIDFTDETGKRVGLVSHDFDMKRATGQKGPFNRYHDLTVLPNNAANPKLPPETFMTILDIFDLIKKSKEAGVTPTVSLDLKEEGDGGLDFGRWIGGLIRDYGFQDHMFASSFFKSNVVGVREACKECRVGGLVFNDHWALKYLDHRYTSLDLTGLSKATFFFGFLGKEEYPHEFVLIQDDIVFQEPELIDYWRNIRKVKFVGVYVYDKERPYTDSEWKILQKVDWLELDPPQMQQYLKLQEQKTK
ncbi:MAG: hypothetical protein Q8P12_00485 [bacterium]|nr:hypothetical protein [bacterium]